MPTTRATLAVLLIALACGFTSATAQEGGTPAAEPASQDLPAAADLFEAYIEAIGGREAIARHRNRVLHGIHHTPETGNYQVVTLWAQAPNLLKARLEVPGIGTTIRSSDGTTVWGSNLDGPPFEISGAEKAEFMDGALFIGEAAYEERYSSIQTTRMIEVNSRPTYQVEFTTVAGLKGSCLFDRDSHLLVGRYVSASENQGPLIFLAEYKEFEGVRMPTVQQQRIGQKIVSEFRFQTIEVNAPKMPEFSMPKAGAKKTGE